MDAPIETENQAEEIKRKTKYTGKVEKISLAGALINIDIDQPAVLHISQVPPLENGEAVKRVEDVLSVGQDVDVWIKRVKPDHVELTMVKPLDLEWRDLKPEMVVKGKVVRLEKFGVFVEIGAERPGLIHISELAHGYIKQPSEVVKEGDEVEVKVLDVNRRKKQIKLSMKALQEMPVVEEKPREAQPVREPSRPSSEPRSQASGEPKPRRAPRRPRRDEPATDFSVELEELNSEAEKEPTAMEIAIREAMEKVKQNKKQREESRKDKSVSKEQEDILSRTLERKIG